MVFYCEASRQIELIYYTIRTAFDITDCIEKPISKSLTHHLLLLCKCYCRYRFIVICWKIFKTLTIFFCCQIQDKIIVFFRKGILLLNCQTRQKVKQVIAAVNHQISNSILVFLAEFRKTKKQLWDKHKERLFKLQSCLY